MLYGTYKRALIDTVTDVSGQAERPGCCAGVPLPGAGLPGKPETSIRPLRL